MTTAASAPLLTSSAPAVRSTGWAERYLLFLGVVLLGYALDGRGFAYLGYPPLFIGELTMVVGLAVLVGAQGWSQIFQSPVIVILSVFVLLGFCRTVFDFRDYGMDALRDAAIYYYAAFAFIVAGLIVAEPRRLLLMLRLYRRFIPLFLIGIPVVAFLYRFYWNALPRWPWGDVPIIQEKEGDVMVHLAGIFAFFTCELFASASLAWTALLALNAAALGVVDRAGLLSFGAALGLGIVHRPRGQLAWRMILAVVAAVATLAISGIRIEIPGGKGRELSFEQIKTNLTSITGDAGSEGMDSTKEWRINWWNDIIADTFHGRRFWTGVGFGVNLADEYGYQVMADHSLRSPHNGHMTILARMGVPGLTIWVLLQLSFGFQMARGYLRSREAGEPRWQAVFFFIGVFWLAFLINATFDVYLEGPMGGIWFWSVFGLGIGASWVYQYRPEALYERR